MKARLRTWWRVLLALPLAGAYSLDGCTADAMREVADSLDEQADSIDRSDDDLDLGDWLSDEIEDW
ncbi:MAG: hypothetical protein JSV19_10870 [Phycisphaerales bacterium]|nr:MAG: hypothetical protein JSV19_10870 [Phycisphaerales bacterium]